MFATVSDRVQALEDSLAAVDVACLSGADAVRLVEVLTEAERACAATRTLAARRVEDANAWQGKGHRSAAEWMAATTGTTQGQAVAILETGRRLDQLDDTRHAFQAGQLSEPQVREIASAAAADPTAERRLVEAARRRTLKGLRDECRAVRAAAAENEVDRYERIRRSRYLRHWAEADGAIRLDARLTPVDGARLLAAVDAHKQTIFEIARKEGRTEPYQAYAADALVALADGKEPAKAAAGIQVRVDHTAFVRGHTVPGEICEIPGIGPIPVATARHLANDAILKVVVTDGADITTVAHAGRTIPAHLRTALAARDPECVVPGCDERDGLEIDHRIPFAEGGPTELDNLARLCRWHHYLKTHRGWQLGGGPGDWTWHQVALELERPPPVPVG